MVNTDREATDSVLNKPFSWGIATLIAAEYGLPADYLYQYHPRTSRPRNMLIVIQRLRNTRYDFISMDMNIKNTQIARAMRYHIDWLKSDKKYREVFNKINSN